MNIFALDINPYTAASYHCDKHVVKMIVEYAQLLSTAHRVLDGQAETIEWNDSFILNGEVTNECPRKKTMLVLDQEALYVDWETDRTGDDDNNTHESVIGKPNLIGRKCYNSTHMNHPCAVWARHTDSNYHWLAQLFEGCLREYTKRYQKNHATGALLSFLYDAPRNIEQDVMTPFALAMPDKCKVTDEILSYQNFYVEEKARFAKWTNTPVPKWFTQKVSEDESHFSRTR